MGFGKAEDTVRARSLDDRPGDQGGRPPVSDHQVHKRRRAVELATEPGSSPLIS
jgi:hypothetical protein